MNKDDGMSCHDFQQKENENLRSLIRLLEKHCGGIALAFSRVSYVLLDDIPESDEARLNELLTSLTPKQELELKRLYL